MQLKAGVLLCLILWRVPALCQNDSTNQEQGFQQQDLGDWTAKVFSKKPKPPKDNYLLLIPFISANPTAGFIMGIGLTYTYKVNPEGKYLSVVSSNASYSTKGMVNLNMKTNLFVWKEKLNLTGDWRYLVNSETTYGLGTNRSNSTSTDINGLPTSTDSLGQDLKYHQLRLSEIGSLKIFPNFFAGIGFHFDRFYEITDATADNGDSALSYHYKYSKTHGFDAKEYNTSGFSINFLYDNRDNQVNSYRGLYGNVNWRFNITGLGSTQNSNSLLTEFKSFFPLDKYKNKHILAFWLYGNFQTGGTLPYLALPALGYDMRQRTGRGYKFGQFRGENFAYGESEFRFLFSKHTGILGGDVFINTSTTSDNTNGVKLFDYLKTGYGGGLRIMLDKRSRTRLAIDLGVSDKTVGFYLGAQETF